MSKNSKNDLKQASAITDVKDQKFGWRIDSSLERFFNVHWCRGLFIEQNDFLKLNLPSQKTLVVTTKTVDRLYGDQIRSCFNECFEYKYIVLPFTEQGKDITMVTRICHEATSFGLGPQSQIIAIGGGVCLDCAAIASSLFLRGIAYIKIPTTLVGLVDAGISIRNSVNLASLKNQIGILYPPITVLLDPIFLQTLPGRYLRCGVAEMIKLGLVCEERIYDLAEQSCAKLILTNFQEPEATAHQLIKLSIDTMIAQLSTDLYELASRQKAISFGHTFSLWIESASNYTISHGEAVAIDMAICCCISNELGILSKETLERILVLFDQLELQIYDDVIVPSQLWSSLVNITIQRNGKLNLALPARVGECFFIEELAQLEYSLLLQVINNLSKRRDNRKMSHPGTSN